MGDSFASIITSSPSLTLILPTNPDIDHTAAGLALYLALGKSKNVSIACYTPMTVGFHRLIGVDKITDKIGEKNMVISFKGYDSSNIEKVSADVVNGEFQLKVFTMGQATPPKKEHLAVSFSGIGNSTIVLIGGSHEDHFPILTLEDSKQLTKIHVGIKPIAGADKHNIKSFAKQSSSVCELCVKLLIEMGAQIDADIATNLIAGIEDGTQKYTSDLVTADTFEIVSKLMKQGGKRTPNNIPSRESFPPGAIPGETLESPDDVEQKEVPPNWMEEPKVYTGTSVS